MMGQRQQGQTRLHSAFFVFAASLDMSLRKEDFWREMKGKMSLQWLEKPIPRNVL